LKSSGPPPKGGGLFSCAAYPRPAVTCPSCKTPYAAGSIYCSVCGFPLERPVVMAVPAPASTGGLPACAVHPGVMAVRPCPRCGTFACASCLVTMPAGDQLCVRCEASGVAGLLPWDQREQLGTLRAFFSTSWKVISGPDVTFTSARQEGSLGSSMLFATLANIAGMLTTLVAYGFIFGGMFLFGGENGGLFKEWSGPAVAGMIVAGVLGYLVLLVLMGLGSLLFFSALDHLALKLVGANPAAWTVTVRAYALSMGPYLVGLIPFCGFYVFPIWSLVVRVFAYKGLHRTSGGKAALGALLPIGAFVLLIVGGYALLLVAVMNAG
jgi:hypothetical protein